MAVLIDSISRRRDCELSGRTMGNAVVNVAAPADTPGDGTSWIGRTLRVRVTRGGPHSLAGEIVDADAAASFVRMTGNAADGVRRGREQHDAD